MVQRQAVPIVIDTYLLQTVGQADKCETQGFEEPGGLEERVTLSMRVDHLYLPPIASSRSLVCSVGRLCKIVSDEIQEK